MLNDKIQSINPKYEVEDATIESAPFKTTLTNAIASLTTEIITNQDLDGQDQIPEIISDLQALQFFISGGMNLKCFQSKITHGMIDLKYAPQNLIAHNGKRLNLKNKEANSPDLMDARQLRVTATSPSNEKAARNHYGQNPQHVYQLGEEPPKLRTRVDLDRFFIYKNPDDGNEKVVYKTIAGVQLDIYEANNETVIIALLHENHSGVNMTSAELSIKLDLTDEEIKKFMDLFLLPNP